MRFHSLLFVGISLACFETSSARSISTVVRSIASGREDVPANAVVAEKIEEERGGGANLLGTIAEKGKDIVSSITKRNVLDEFKSLELHKDIGEELRKKRLEVLATRAKKADKDTKAMIKKFSKSDDDHLFGPMLVALKEANVDEAIQTNVRNAVYKAWSSHYTSPWRLFDLLKLNDKTDTLRYIELLTIWIEYQKPTPDDIKMVLDSYKDKIGLMVLEGMDKVKGAEDVVKSLQDGILAFWGNKGVSAKNLLTSIDKDFTLSYVTWVKYAKDEISGFVEHEANNINVLLKTLVAVKEAKLGDKIEENVKESTFSWLEANKPSPDNLFKLLKLDTNTDTLYTNRLSVWVEYMQAHEITTHRVASRIDAQICLKVLDGLSNVKGAENVVESLQKELVEDLDFSGKSTTDLFFGIDGSAISYATWVKLAAKEDPYLDPVIVVSTELGILEDHKNLVKMLVAMKDANVGLDAISGSSVRQRVEKMTFDLLVEKKVSANDLFNLLKLNEGTDSPHYTNLLSVWVEYMQATNIETDMVINTYKGRTGLTVLDGLSNVKGAEDVVESLQNSLIAFWIDKGRTSESVFDQVEGGSTLSYVTWIKFLKTLSPKLQPVISKASFIKGENNKMGELLKIFDALIEAKIENNIQPRLEEMLMESWVSESKSAQDVFKDLKLSERDVSDDSLNNPWMRLWVLYAKNKLEMPDEELTKVIEDADEEVRAKLHKDFNEVVNDIKAQNEAITAKTLRRDSKVRF